MPEKSHQMQQANSRRQGRRGGAPCRAGLQRGQASVFVVVLIVVVLVGILVLFNSGQLTRQKMELQNAADAAAYSVGVLRARTFNFMAYTNRAMVANEAAIGQFSAFAAWRNKYRLAAQERTASLIALKSSLNAASALICGCFGDVIVKMITAIPKALNLSAQPIGTVGKVMGDMFAVLNYGLNLMYGGFQWTVRASNMTAQMDTTPKIIDTNAPGARLSNFGALAVVLSMLEQERFLSFAGPKVNRKKYRKGAMRRYIALVNDSRDAWTRDRRRDDLRTPPLNNTVPIIPGFLRFSFDNFGFGYPIHGGTELRTLGKGRRARAPGWSSADTIGFGFSGGISVRVNLPVVGWKKVPIPLGDLAQLSLGGASQERVPGKGGSVLGAQNMKGWMVPELYGQAPYYTRLAMIDAIGSPLSLGGYQPRTKHLGLAHYHFIDPNRYPASDASPLIIVGVRKDLDALETSDQLPPDRRLGGGRFQLETVVGAARPDAVERDLDEAARQRLREMVREVLDSGLKDVGSLPPPFNSVIDVDDLVDRMVNAVSGAVDPAISVFLSPLDRSRDRSAMFSLAAAQVYYKNPERPAELGSMFNPYWEVRMRPLDDNVRKWALVTQDPEFRSLVAYLNRTDPDRTDMRHELQLLGTVAR